MQTFFYWYRSEQEYRGLEHSLESCYLKNRKLSSATNCLVIHHWAWPRNPYFSWTIHVRKYSLWVKAKYFPNFWNTLTTHCLQTCTEFIDSISQILYLTLLLRLTVLRSCHFINTNHNHITVDSQQLQGCNIFTPFFHPWHHTNISTTIVIATCSSPNVSLSLAF